MDCDPYNQIVPRFSGEDNVHACYLNGAIDSLDFDSNFKLKGDIKARTVLPYERQRLDFRPPLQPLADSPVDPPKPKPAPAPTPKSKPKLKPPSPSPVASPAIAASVLGAEIKELEAVIAAQDLAMTQMEIEIRKLKTTRRLLSNLVFSWCEYFKCTNARLFD
jgi:hypothetical protein